MKHDDLASPEYRATLQEMHKSIVWGNKGYKYIEDILPFYTSIEAKNILDYGCGQQTLKQCLFDIDVRGYDIGIPELSALPEPADLVVSTDVLEHIEPEYLKQVIDHIFSLANKGVFLHIATKLAKRTLPDGRNAHLIVYPAAWWLKRFERLPPGWKMTKHISGSKTLKVWFLKEETWW